MSSDGAGNGRTQVQDAGADVVSVETLTRWATERDWYHTLELAPGVVTSGWFDTRSVAGTLPWPALSGRRCLDVGTFDGFWAFEMERRGAAEVVAIDVPDPGRWDWPAGSTDQVRTEIGKRKGRDEGFAIARRAFGSSVERRDLSVYELDPAVVGRFDVVYVGSLLVHLRDPVAALMAVRSVCEGTLVLVDAVDPWASLVSRRPVARLDGRGRPWWWLGNGAVLARMVEAAGFSLTGAPRRLWMKAGSSQRAQVGLGPGSPRASEVLRLALKHGRTAAGREAVLHAVVGDPHVCIVARPA